MTLQRAAEELLPLRPVVFQVLLSLADGERHGYAIVQDIGERSPPGCSSSRATSIAPSNSCWTKA